MTSLVLVRAWSRQIAEVRRTMRRKTHPFYRRSWRWWVAHQPAWKLFLWGVSLLAFLAVLLSALETLSAKATTGIYDRFFTTAFLVRALSMLRYLLGSDQYPTTPGNQADAVWSTIGEIVAVFVPALIVAILLIRIWSLNAFVWRRQASICLPWEVDEAAYRKEKEATEEGAIAVRFYKRLRGLQIWDLSCEAYLRFLETSPVDGNQIIRTLPLKVLGASGALASLRTWPLSSEGTTFTLWIPMNAPLDGRTVRSIQGFSITDSSLQALLIRTSGTVSGLGVRIADEKWYSLSPDAIQIGRFAKVAVNLKQNSRLWAGWPRFDEAAVQGLFVYGRLVNPDALREFYGHHPRQGIDYVRARIAGFKRSWCVATDNSDKSKRFVYRDAATGRAPKAQVLFLGLEGCPMVVTEGILLKVDSLMIARLVGSDGNFLVEDVTELVHAEKVWEHGQPDIVWTYLGKADSVATAHRGLADGTAVIAQDFLNEVSDGMHSYDLVLRSTYDAEPLPEVPILDLIRQTRTPRALEGRPAEQG
jgi:hypothetical protein